MHQVLRRFAMLFLLVVPAASQGDSLMTANSGALAAVDEYFASFNARDPARFARSLHYPHMRIDGRAKTSLWQRWEDYAAQVDFSTIAARGNWHHTQLDSAEVIQAGQDKVHVLVRYTRFDPDNQPILSEESLYVVTLVDNRWAIQMRSSFLEQAMPARQ